MNLLLLIGAILQPADGFVPLAKARTIAVRPAPGGTQAGYLGIALAPDAAGGLKVSAVETGSPALAAGLRIGDLLTALDGRPTGSREDFRARLQMKFPGDPAALGILRDGKTSIVAATLAAISRPMNPADDVRPVLGVRTPPPGGDEPGIRIDSVTEGMPAAAAGLKAGDIVEKLDGMALGPTTPIAAALFGKRPGDEVALAVRRGGAELAVTLRLARPEPPPTRAGAALPAAGFWRLPRLRLALIGVEFADLPRQVARPDADRAAAFFASAPAESLAEYFRRESFGKLILDGKFAGWTAVAKKRGDYVQGSGTSNLNALPTEALDKLLAVNADTLKDFDALCFLYAGERVRGNRGSLYSPHAGRVFHKGKLWPYVLGPDGGAAAAGALPLAREFAFMLGLPDLAARSDPAAEGLDQWCLLGAANAAKPPPLSPWAKEQLGWLEPTTVDPTVRQQLWLEPSDTGPTHCLKALVRPDGSEYFLFENRRARGAGTAATPGGLLVWRVVHGLPILEESHGIAGPAGPRSLPEHVPYPSPHNDSFTPETTPSSRSPRGGGLPVRATEIRRIDAGRIALRLGYEFL